MGKTILGLLVFLSMEVLAQQVNEKLSYHMNHQVWKKDHNDSRGIGGDQISMALSSWRLVYAYTGNERILDNMRFPFTFNFSV